MGVELQQFDHRAVRARDIAEAPVASSRSNAPRAKVRHVGRRVADGAAGTASAIVLLLLAALAARLTIAYVLFPGSGFGSDVGTYAAWANTMATFGPGGFYANAGYADYFFHRTGHSIGFASAHGDGANMDDLETHDTRPLLERTAFMKTPQLCLNVDTTSISRVWLTT